MDYAVSEAKIVNYLLTHFTKSGFFLSFGYSLTNWTQLRDDLLAIAAGFPSTLRRSTPFGDEYEIIGEIRAPNGRFIKLRTGWMIREGQADTMTFVTAYPVR